MTRAERWFWGIWLSGILAILVVASHCGPRP